MPDPTPLPPPPPPTPHLLPPLLLLPCPVVSPQSRVIRLPVHVHDFLNRVRKATIEMTDKNGKLPTDEELAKHLEVTVVRIQVRTNARPRLGRLASLGGGWGPVGQTDE